MLVAIGTQEGVQTAYKEKNRYWRECGSYYQPCLERFGPKIGEIFKYIEN